jgi:hypothetical protein
LFVVDPSDYRIAVQRCTGGGGRRKGSHDSFAQRSRTARAVE